MIDIELVLKSIQVTGGDGFLSESWTVPCEIISQSLLGAGPPDEDAPPAYGGDPHPHPPQNWNQPLPKLGFSDFANEEAELEDPARGNDNLEENQQDHHQQQNEGGWDAWPIAVLEEPILPQEGLWAADAPNLEGFLGLAGLGKEELP